MIPVPYNQSKRNNRNTEQKNKRPRENENPTINIEMVINSITKKDSVIFCRVSSYGQTGKFTISFEVQEHKGQVCANLFKLKVMGTIKVVESAYDGKACTLKSLISKNKGKNIIIYNVSRFCRNVERGMELLDYALKCNTRLFFVDEGIVWDRNHTDFRNKLREKLYLAQEESAALGRRVKDALAEKKRRGYHIGGTPKYGFKVVDIEGGRKAVPDVSEGKVIEFIDMCRQIGTPVKTINECMKIISKYNDPIILYFNNEKVNHIVEPLSYGDIADLLNEYQVFRRGQKWTASSVSSVVKRKYDDMVVNLECMGFGSD